MSHSNRCLRSDGDWICAGDCTHERDAELDRLRAENARLTEERDRTRRHALYEARCALLRLSNWVYSMEPQYPSNVLDRAAELVADIGHGRVSGAAYRAALEGGDK